jgi:hypothetical protein
LANKITESNQVLPSRQHRTPGLLEMMHEIEIKHFALAVMVIVGTLALAPQNQAAACANGVYRAGCVGPHGAAVVRKPY